MNANIKQILVVSFGNGKLFFCAVDDKRIVFFNIFFYSLLASVTNKETVISVIREGKEIDSAIPSMSGAKLEVNAFSGFDFLKKDSKLPEKEWLKWMNDCSFSTSIFKEGDVIEIHKDWQLFEEENKWLSTIATDRSFGEQYSELFHHVKHADPINKFFELKHETSFSKNIIFTSFPDNEYLNRFY